MCAKCLLNKRANGSSQSEFSSPEVGVVTLAHSLETHVPVQCTPKQPSPDAYRHEIVRSGWARVGRFVETPPPILILEGHALAGCYIYTGCAGLTLGGLQSSSTTPAMLELSHMKVSSSTASFFGALMQHCPHALLLVELHSSGCLKP